MLKIYERDIDKLTESEKRRLVFDAELGFSEKITHELDTSANNITREIDNAEFRKEQDGVYMLFDRFDHKIYPKFLSTGCKAALLVLYRPDIIVDTLECGYNAVGAMIKYCKDGNIVINNIRELMPVHGTAEDKIDVIVRNRHFTNVQELNDYINDEDLEDLE